LSYLTSPKQQQFARGYNRSTTTFPMGAIVSYVIQNAVVFSVGMFSIIVFSVIMMFSIIVSAGIYSIINFVINIKK